MHWKREQKRKNMIRGSNTYRLDNSRWKVKGRDDTELADLGWLADGDEDGKVL